MVDRRREWERRRQARRMRKINLQHKPRTEVKFKIVLNSGKAYTDIHKPKQKVRWRSETRVGKDEVIRHDTKNRGKS